MFLTLGVTLPREWKDVLEVAFFTSACPEFLRRNTRFSSIEQHLETACKIAKDATSLGIRYRRAFVSMAFRSPFSKDDLTDRAFGICRELYDMGYNEIVPADTNGIASICQVIKLYDALRKTGIPRECLGFHGHDLGGKGIEAVVASLPFVTTVDVTILGIGGCPFSPGAPGNMNARLVADVLGALGISTGISYPHLERAETALKDILNRHGLSLSRT